jgi:hypothetical protein
MIKSYIFFIVLFIIIFVLYKFYSVVFTKFQYCMGYVMFGVGVLTIIAPVIMNNLHKVTNKKKLKKMLQKKYAPKL